MNHNKIIRQSRDGYVFDENENSWHISKEIKINFSKHILGINKKNIRRV